MSPANYFVAGSLLIICVVATLRLYYILPGFNRNSPPCRLRKDPNHVFIVLGSGGHTAEMLMMLRDLDASTYTHRSYVISAGDSFSAGKATEFEKRLALSSPQGQERTQDLLGHQGGMKEKKALKWSSKDFDTAALIGYSIHTVPRARQIHQSLLTTPLSCLRCLVSSLRLLASHPHGKPDLILTNGPATALIVILASLVLEYFSFLGALPHLGPETEELQRVIRIGERRRTRSIYAESWARVCRPSLSCRIIATFGLCDRVLVQWKMLEERGWGEYKGVLVG